MRNRRTLSIIVGVLVVAIAAFLIVGLAFEGSWPGQLLRGAGFAREKEPTVLPAAHIRTLGTVPQGAGLAGGLDGVPVKLEGDWGGGWCKVWGTDADHPSGVEYHAGTFRMNVQGGAHQGYCIDLSRTIKVGETYDANVYVSSEADLCPIYWILTNYSRDNPGAELNNREEGVAIQAAIWHYVNGFQPVWRAGYWCGNQAVHNRAVEIMNAAQGQCIPIPSNLDLSASALELDPGETADLTATVVDQYSQPYPGQDVAFDATMGALGVPSGVTDGQGQAPNTINSNEEGEADVTADITGQFQFAVADPASLPRQRTVIIMPVSYEGDDIVHIVWDAPTAVFLSGFKAVPMEGNMHIQWETSSEIDNLGFNVYHSNDKEGPWTKLNDEIIESKVPPGSVHGASYEWVQREVDPEGDHFYLLEDIDLNGTVTRHGPINPE